MTGSTAPELPLTVAPADDHPVVRAGLKTLLEADSGLRLWASSRTCREKLGGVPIVKPDVLVPDLTMVGKSSLGVVAATPSLKIVILTMQEEPGFGREALRLGASGHVVKDAAAEELLLALRPARLDVPASGARHADGGARFVHLAAHRPGDPGAATACRGLHQRRDRPPALSQPAHRRGVPGASAA